MKRRDLIPALAALGTGATLTARAQGEGNRIVLGQSAAFSGAAAQLGIQMNAGAKFYFDQVNAAGGVNGRKIELRTLDDGYEPDRCKANTATFIKDKVLALFGYVGTPTCLAALPLVRESRIPFFGPFTGAQALRDPVVPNVFHLRASYNDETELIVGHLANLGLEKVAVFRQNDSYGQAGLDGVNRALTKRGLKPLAIGLVERNSVDVAAAVAAIVPAMPDAIVQIGAYKGCAAFIRAARAAGFGGQFYNVSFVGTQALSDELGAEARGIVVSQVMPFPFSESKPIAREYLQAVQRAGGDAKPNYSSMEGYLAAKVLVEGMRKAGGGLSRESLIQSLESIQNADFGGFKVNFGPGDRVASKFVEISMLNGDGKVRR